MIKYLKTDDSKCVGCMSCVSVCSTMYFKEDNPAKSSILVEGLGGGAFRLMTCDQECRRCVAECPTQAITISKAGVVLVNKKLCVGCLACVAVCPRNAMRYYPGYKNPFKCIACGACVKKCPTGALSLAEKTEGAAAEPVPETAGTGEAQR